MKPYAETDVFTPQEVAWYKLAVEIVCCLPSQVNGEPVRCHELARFVGKLLKLEVQDGLYGFVEHSWLWTGPKQGKMLWQLPNILDVYVPGKMPPVQLVHVSTALPMVYQPGPKRTDTRQDVLRELRNHLQAAGKPASLFTAAGV